jgi:hypothetical protein
MRRYSEPSCRSKFPADASDGGRPTPPLVIRPNRDLFETHSLDRGVQVGPIRRPPGGNPREVGRSLSIILRANASAICGASPWKTLQVPGRA